MFRALVFSENIIKMLAFFFIKGTIYKWYIKKESTIYKWYIKKVSLIYFFATSIEMLKGIFLDCGTRYPYILFMIMTTDILQAWFTSQNRLTRPPKKCKPLPIFIHLLYSF